MDIQFAEDVIDFFITNERFSHMGDGRGGFGRLTGPDKGSKRALAEFYGRLIKAFQFTPAQADHFWLAFETLQDGKLRKECVATLREEKTAKAQVLGSAPWLIQRLASMYESPLKQVHSIPAESSAQGSFRSTPISAQVRLCSPSLLPGERFSPVQYVLRMYTRIRDDDAPAEVDRPLPRLRSQVSSAAVSAGRAEDASARNFRASAPTGGRNESARPAGRSKVSLVSEPPSGSAQQSAMPAAARALAEAVPMPVLSNIRKVRALDSDAPAAQSHAESALADGSDGGQQPVDSTTMPPSAQSLEVCLSAFAFSLLWSRMGSRLAHLA